jgi:hypothetical protein
MEGTVLVVRRAAEIEDRREGVRVGVVVEGGRRIRGVGAGGRLLD